jgi:hypothetical protein
MPLSYGIPLGLLILLIGALLSIVSKHKKLAKLVMIAGGALTLLAILLVVLAENSGMGVNSSQ